MYIILPQYKRKSKRRYKKSHKKYGRSKYSKSRKYGKRYRKYRKYGKRYSKGGNKNKYFPVDKEVRQLKFYSQPFLDYFGRGNGLQDDIREDQLTNLLISSPMSTFIKVASCLVGGYAYCKYSNLNEANKIDVLNLVRKLKEKCLYKRLKMMQPGHKATVAAAKRHQRSQRRQDLLNAINQYITEKAPVADLPNGQHIADGHNIGAAIRNVAAGHADLTVVAGATGKRTADMME